MKILQIAYYYPPMGGAGVQRGLKFSRFLPLHGVQPVVLACDDPHYVRDDSLLAEVPAGLEVHRVPHSPWLARLAARRRAAAPSSASANAAPIASAAAGPSLRGRLRDGLRDGLRDAALRAARALQWPDYAAPWARRALLQARQILRAHAAAGAPIELVFSSSPPASAHALGERIAREAGLPWVADFRDLWTDNPAYDAPAWRRAIDRRTEQRWLDGATGVVTVTPSWREGLAARLASGAPVAFIPNGYDEDDFAMLAPARHEAGVFTLVHTGTFYGPRDPAGLLGGLARYLESAPRPTTTSSAPQGGMSKVAEPHLLMSDRQGQPRLRVRLVGNMGARFAAAVAAFSQRHPGVIDAVPYLPHGQALAELMAADALLLAVGGGRGPAVRGWLPGKIFEYLRSGKPVLTLGDPGGDAARLIHEHGRGPVVGDDDTAGIAQALSALLQGRWARAAGETGHDAPASARIFERRALAGQLADFLRACQARHRAGAHG